MKKEAGRSGTNPDWSFDPRELAARFGDRKIQAIQYVREHTGLGLKEAKDLVDAAYEGRPAESSQAEIQNKAAQASEIDFRELAAKFGDRKIQAIQYVRERTGLGLKEAKDLVDAAYKKAPFAAPKEQRESSISYAGSKEAYTGPEIEDKPRRWKVFLLGAALLLLSALVYFFVIRG